MNFDNWEEYSGDYSKYFELRMGSTFYSIFKNGASVKLFYNGHNRVERIPGIKSIKQAKELAKQHYYNHVYI